jgi:hypothetical protein
MKVMLRKQLKRKLEDGKDSNFEVHGRVVPLHKLSRFVKRKEMTQAEILREQMRELYPSVKAAVLIFIATPSYIACNTPEMISGDEATQTATEPAVQSNSLGLSGEIGSIEDTSEVSISATTVLAKIRSATPISEDIVTRGAEDVSAALSSRGDDPHLRTLPPMKDLLMDLCGSEATNLYSHHDVGRVADMVAQVCSPP